MAIIREMPVVTNTPGGGQRQRGGAVRPVTAAAYDEDPLRMVMEPALRSFGENLGGQLGGQFGAQVGQGAGSALVKGIGAKLIDQSASPAQKMAQANAMLESLRSRYNLSSKAELSDPAALKKAGITDEHMEMIRFYQRLYNAALTDSYRNQLERQ